jgi:hypothetical protein
MSTNKQKALQDPVVTTVQAFKTKDGAVFVDEQQAARRSVRIALEEWSDKVRLCKGGEWTEDMVLDALLEDASHVGALLMQHAANVVEPVVPVPGSSE